MWPITSVNLGGTLLYKGAVKFKNKVKRVWNDLNEGNQQKKDIEGKKIVNPDGTPIKGKEHADNYAHSLADAKIAQRGKTDAAIAFTIGVAKEGYDLVTKVGRGDNIKETLKDGYKDMQNNLRGLSWGLRNPNGNAEEYFAQLDLDRNQIIAGYNNGITQAQRIETVTSMHEEHQLAQNKIKAAQSGQDARILLEQTRGPVERYGLAPLERHGLVPQDTTQTKRDTTRTTTPVPRQTQR